MNPKHDKKKKREKLTARHIKMKPQNIKDKQNILKLAIKKQQIAYKGINLDCGIFKSNKSQKSMELRYIMRKEKKNC